MILAHSIIGLMPVSGSNFSWFWFIGSIVADLDHLFILYKNKIFSWNKLVDTIRFEGKYGISFKTKYMHSVFGVAITTIPFLFISKEGAFYYFVAYALHLILDLPDIDKKQYFYPFKKEMRGFLPIFSRTEIIFTILLIIFYFYKIKIPF